MSTGIPFEARGVRSSRPRRAAAAAGWLLLVSALLSVGFLASSAQAATIDWTALDPAWDDTDTSGSQSFTNVDGSGVDIIVSYTDNMFDRNSVPDIYTAATAPSPEIIGTLRFTNDRSRDPFILGTAVTITFSEDVFLNDLGTVSLSTILGLQENMVIEAFDAAGNSVLATSYGTNTPGLTQLDTDGDAAYRSRGLGAQEDGLYGDTSLSYLDTAVRSVVFTNYVTEIDGDLLVKGFSSQGIKNVEFQVAAVPEPSTTLLLGLGLAALTRRRVRPR